MSSEKEMGIASLKAGDFQAAIASLEAAVRVAPGDYDLQVYLASAYSRANRLNDSVTALTQAVAIQPNNAKARFNLGVAYERAGRADYAATVFQQALDIQPNYPEAQQGLQRVRSTAVVSSMQPAYSLLAGTAPAGAMPLSGAAPLGGHSPLMATQPLGGSPHQATASAGIPGLYPSTSPYNAPAQPQFGALPHSGAGLGQPVSSAQRVVVPDENIPMGLLAGVVLSIALGIGFAYASIAAGFRIPYFTIAIGWLIAKGVVYAAREAGYAQGIIAAVGTAVAAGGGLAIMHLNGVEFSPFAYVITALAVGSAWKVASDAD